MVPCELKCSLLGACAGVGVTSSSSLCSHAMEEVLLDWGGERGFSGCFQLLQSHRDL